MKATLNNVSILCREMATIKSILAGSFSLYFYVLFCFFLLPFFNKDKNDDLHSQIREQCNTRVAYS